MTSVLTLSAADPGVTLVGTGDNDLYPGLPTQIYAFAVDEKAAGITLKRERVFLPVFFLWDFFRFLF